MSSNSFGKSIRAHSIHVAVERDFHRMRLLHKQDIKQEKEFSALERRLSSHAKWNQRADNKNAIQNAANDKNNQKRLSITLDEFMQREKIKHDIMDNSKKLANENIRPT
jgi:hypothetical protein